jgi:ribosome maturation factor RimP
VDSLENKLSDMFRPVIESLGFELVAVEIISSGGTVMRVYIDAPNGITVDDCADVSYQVSGILDVEDPLHGKYSLEVSSPGLDRPLVTLEHFRRFLGERVKIRCTEPVLGRKRFTGKLKGIEDETLIVEVDNEVYDIPLAIIEKANLVAEFS